MNKPPKCPEDHKHKVVYRTVLGEGFWVCKKCLEEVPEVWLVQDEIARLNKNILNLKNANHTGMDYYESVAIAQDISKMKNKLEELKKLPKENVYE